MAVDDRGYAFVDATPGSQSWSPQQIDGARTLTGVSCPSASLCVAVDEEGNLLASTSPAGGGWSIAGIDPGHHLRAVSCASQSLCVAVDSAGSVVSSANPAGGAGAWHSQRVDFGELTAVSCSTAGACVATDGSGEALASANPTAGAATWNLTPIDGERLTGVSCAPTGLCVAVDGRGVALASDDPTAGIPTWSAANVDSVTLSGVSCLAGGLCTAVDTAGRSLSGRVPPPGATTLTASEVSSTAATLAGAVNPNDAVLGACSFEFGTVPYTQSVPCSVLPAPAGGTQAVSAQLAGLSPNTTYHYRVLASSPAGTTAGADVTFTTAVSSLISLVYPHPSITGTPAVGQRLTCHPGTPAEASAQLSYGWLRDLIPIPGSTASSYTSKGQDSGHHLQCQVTATNGGGSVVAKSAFVTVPAGGAPVSAGETSVGRASFRNGKLSVPVTCSAHASRGCEVALRLTVALRHLTVTLARLRLRLPTGTHRTLTIALGSSGRRLLASRKHLSASLYVSGTVIGVIESQLSRQLVALGVSSRGASTHAARRR